MINLITQAYDSLIFKQDKLRTGLSFEKNNQQSYQWLDNTFKRKYDTYRCSNYATYCFKTFTLDLYQLKVFITKTTLIRKDSLLWGCYQILQSSTI